MHKLKVYATKSLFIYRLWNQDNEAQTESLCYKDTYFFTGSGGWHKLKVYATKMPIFLQVAIEGTN